MIRIVGAKTIGGIENIGRFARFFLRSMIVSARTCLSSPAYPLIWNQMNIIGVRSFPVVMITGAFVGMTLAVQAYDQLAGMGLEEHLGVLINISVVKELGPVDTNKVARFKFGTPLPPDEPDAHNKIIDFIKENLTNWGAADYIIDD